MSFGNLVKHAVFTGAPKGARAALSLLIFMVPISFGVALLNWTGLMQVISDFISPLFRHIGLPGSAALAFLSGALLSCYSAIAVMVTLPLTHREITILALMVLFSHNLPVEVTVLKKAGSSGLFILAYRLGASLVGALVLNLLLPADNALAVIQNSLAPGESALSFGAMAEAWAAGNLVMIIKVLCIVVGLMILHEIMEATGVSKVFSRVLTPFLKLLGLSSKSAFLWIVANLLGLAYGAGIILSEKAENKIADRDIRHLNVSMATCHSTFEDTLLFMAIGASFFWIFVPRFVLAGIAVWLYRWGKKEI